MNAEYLWKKLGKIIQNALLDASVNEIMLNSNGTLWIQRQGVLEGIAECLSPQQAMTIVQAVAQYAGLFINESNPSLICSLPFNNARISISIPPMTSCVSFNIRKHSIQKSTLEDYQTKEILSDTRTNYLKNSIQNKKNILVSGGPGSGKTTLTNALLNEIAEEMPHGHRVLILEDTCELQSSIANCLFLKTSTSRSMTQLIQYALRAAPQAIVVGEVVDGAALDLLKAWNVGCPGGLATIHANSALMSLQRLEDLAMEVSATPPKSLIGETVNVVVHIAANRSHPAGRVVTDLIEVSGFDADSSKYQIKYIH